MTHTPAMDSLEQLRHKLDALRIALVVDGDEWGANDVLADAIAAITRPPGGSERLREVVPDWSRRGDQPTDWVNELGTLGQHPGSMPGWVREAIRTIYRGMRQCQHEWVPDADVENAIYCPKCDVTRRALAQPASAAHGGEVSDA